MWLHLNVRPLRLSLLNRGQSLPFPLFLLKQLNCKLLVYLAATHPVNRGVKRSQLTRHQPLTIAHFLTAPSEGSKIHIK